MFITELLAILAEKRNQTRTTDEHPADEGSAGNQYVVDNTLQQYVEIGEVSLSKEPVPSTSAGKPEVEYLEPHKVQRYNSSKSRRSHWTGGETSDGYNELTLKSVSSAVCSEYAQARQKSMGKGKSSKGKRKSKLEPIKQIGGRISQFISDKYNLYAGEKYIDPILPERENFVIDNIYTTNDVEENLPPPPPLLSNDENAYFVLENKDMNRQKNYENGDVADGKDVCNGRGFSYDLAMSTSVDHRVQDNDMPKTGVGDTMIDVSVGAMNGIVADMSCEYVP